MKEILRDSLNILSKSTLTKYEKTLFQKFYQSYLDTHGEKAEWDKLSPLNLEELEDSEKKETPDKARSKELLDSLVICKLNGGLGTSMGCSGPKSAIEVRDGKSFLDLIVRQIEHLNQQHQTDIPLILMNSFYTHEETKKIIRKYRKIRKSIFIQNTFLRIDYSTGLPLEQEDLGELAKSPPGHGDLFFSRDLLKQLEEMKNNGKKYLFVSNSDNLAATIDLKILNYLDKKNISMLMEVTRKTKNDVKGGSIVRTQDGRLELLELAQVPAKKLKVFQNVHTFSNFNTNNIWFNIQRLIEFMRSDFSFRVIANKKSIANRQVIQLETAIGAAIGGFENAEIIRVGRDRFLPVKKTDDLFLLQSDLFSLENGSFKIDQEKSQNALPLIRLGEKFQMYDDYMKRVRHVPSINNLEQLTIIGDIYFGENVSLKGNIIFVCEDSAIIIPDNAAFNNQIISGKLNIQDF